MAPVPAFYSVNESQKLFANRLYHTNDTQCAPGRDIPKNERKLGNGGYRLCARCANLK